MRSCLWLWALSSVGLTCLATAHAQTRSIDAYLEAVKAVGEPPFDAARKGEPGYLENYRREQHQLYRRKAALLLEACRAHPTDARVPELMNKRWVLLGWNQSPADVVDEVLADVDAVLAVETNAQVIQDGTYWRAYYRAHQHAGDAPAMLADVEPFLAAYPTDERGVDLLMQVADDDSADDQTRVAAYRRIGEHYPASYWGKYALGLIRRIESAGKPFDLEFEDAITGRHVSIAELRGKVVVIDFWATTCGPCVAEMPRMKKLYATYRDRGVEFIGVSLDEPESRGGLRAVRAFVEKHEIPWPQFYQGGGYDSEFSTSWGVGSAPTVFVIDKAGRLRDPNARGRLEEMIPRLLDE